MLDSVTSRSARDARRGIDPRSEEAKTGIDCVFLTCLNDEFDLFQGLLLVSGIHLHRADTVEMADFLLTVLTASVLITDTLFLNGAWTVAVEMVTSFHPSVSLLLAIEEHERGMGGIGQVVHGVVRRPLRLTDLRRSIQEAHLTAQTGKAR